MITRVLYNEEKKQYDSVIRHPVQTWEWGQFQITQGHKIYRLGQFEDNKLVSAYSVSFHKIPKLDYTVGTILRGPDIDEDMIKNVLKIAQDENAIFVKLEPDVLQKTYDPMLTESVLAPNYNLDHLKVSPKVAFYPYSFFIDLTKSEDELLENMHSKTRYNIKIANRHGVKVYEKTDDQGFEAYLKLLFDTTKRQGFYLHTEKYHRDLWATLKNTGMPRIMLAEYQGQVLAAFMLFVVKDRLFYPYGASLNVHREVMAPNLLMWEVIKYGKSIGCTSFDMWGSLGPEAKEIEQGYGFHRFKQGFGGQLVQFMGTYDLVVNPILYKAYNQVDKIRWKALRLKAAILRR